MRKKNTLIDYKKFQGRDFVRELVRIRDKRTCQNCGRIWMYGERRFDVHHLEGFCGKKSLGYDRKEEMPALVTLCHRCHLNTKHAIDRMIASDHSRKNIKKHKVFGMLKDGMSLREIARVFNCSYQRIFTIKKTGCG